MQVCPVPGEPPMVYNGSRRGVAQPGSAPAWGAGGPRFKSGRPDQTTGKKLKPYLKTASFVVFFFGSKLSVRYTGRLCCPDIRYGLRMLVRRTDSRRDASSYGPGLISSGIMLQADSSRVGRSILTRQESSQRRCFYSAKVASQLKQDLSDLPKAVITDDLR